MILISHVFLNTIFQYTCGRYVKLASQTHRDSRATGSEVGSSYLFVKVTIVFLPYFSVKYIMNIRVVLSSF